MFVISFAPDTRSTTGRELTLIKILLSIFTWHCYLVNLLGIAFWNPRVHLLVVENVTCDVEMYLGKR